MAKKDSDPVVRTLFTLPQSIVDLVQEYVTITGHRSKSSMVAAAIREYIKPHEKRRQRAAKLLSDRGLSQQDIKKVFNLLEK